MDIGTHGAGLLNSTLQGASRSTPCAEIEQLACHFRHPFRRGQRNWAAIGVRLPRCEAAELGLGNPDELGRLWINKEDRFHPRLKGAQVGRPHFQGGANHDQDVYVRRRRQIVGSLELGQPFSEPNHVRAELDTLVEIAQVQILAPREDNAFIVFGANLENFAVQMDHLGGARPFVQVVDVLGDDDDLMPSRLQLR